MDKLKISAQISKFANIGATTALICMMFFQYKNGGTDISEAQYMATLLVLLNVAIGRIADNTHKDVVIQSLLKDLVEKQDSQTPSSN